MRLIMGGARRGTRRGQGRAGARGAQGPGDPARGRAGARRGAKGRAGARRARRGAHAGARTQGRGAGAQGRRSSTYALHTHTRTHAHSCTVAHAHTMAVLCVLNVCTRAPYPVPPSQNNIQQAARAAPHRDSPSVHDALQPHLYHATRKAKSPAGHCWPSC